MKTILITGGSRGLGRSTAERLARLGHRVLLTARDAAAGERAVAEIRAAHPEAKVEARTLDLASLENVRAFGQALSAEGVTLDVLMNVAGVMNAGESRTTTVDGFEQTLAVNTLAPFLLTSTLLPALRRASAARVVNVSSRLHFPGTRGASVNFDFDDLQLERGYHPERAYKNSKLAVLWFTYELHRRLGKSSVSVNAVCPGFVPTTAAESTKGFLHWVMVHVMPRMPFATTVEHAVDSFTFMAVDPSLDGQSGKFYGEMKPIPSSPESYDEAKARRFWELATTLTRSGAWPG
jgi:NAD(P)-dependent dehydrogenase (short-subunit alcohol dehydrogenase family)